MTTNAANWVEQLLDWLSSDEGDVLPFSLQTVLENCSATELTWLLDLLASNVELLNQQPLRAKLLMQYLATAIAAKSAELRREGYHSDSFDPDSAITIYERLTQGAPEAAAHALQCLAASGDAQAVDALAGIIAHAPPERWQHVGIALSPLWHAPPSVLDEFFDQLVDSNVQPSTLAVLLDLANHTVRAGKFDKHPWSTRGDELSSLLSSLTSRLQHLEKEPQEFGDSVAAVQEVMVESLSLTVALCDTLGLIGDSTATDSLSQAMKLSHRRIQCEAACALARLSSADGRQRLIELASDRVARLRAVTYAEELGLLNEIAAADQHPQALAESELAAWLAGPDQFGIPPSEMELLDVRTQFWPSYEEPQDCFLFRYSYSLPAGQVSNIGIAGPCTSAFSSDLANLPVDDIYAAFAGWQAEHEEIFEVPLPQLNPAQQRVADTLADHLEKAGLAIQRPIGLTFFFGEVALLALVEQEGRDLCAVTDGQESICLPVGERSTSFTPETVLSILRGRKLLRTFNA